MQRLYAQPKATIENFLGSGLIKLLYTK